MIFARGMRFMRLRSCGVSGLASGSATAAAITSASVIGRSGSRRLPVLLEVVVLLMPRCSSGSDDPDTIAALGIHHENQRALDHADHGEPVLAVVLAIVDAADREGIGKYQPSTLERYAMIGEVRGSFGIVPFEVIVFHKSTA